MSQKRQITLIETQKRNENRRSIFLDGEFAFGLDQELLFRFGLHEGDWVDEAELFTIILAEEKKSAKDSAIRFLSYRARSEKEVHDKLLEKGFSDDVVENVISELKSARLVDDTQFAMAFVHDKMLLNPMGPLLIRKELNQAGLTEATIDLAIEEAFRDVSPYEVALELARKKFGQKKGLEWLKMKKRLADFLYRRGFDWDVTRDVLEQIEIENERETE